MNKLLTKIAIAFVGMAMAIGVGVGISSKKNSIRTDAAAGDVFELASSIDANDLITFVGIKNEDYYSSAGQASNNRSTVLVSFSTDTIIAAATTSIFRVEADPNTANYWNFYDISSEQYLYNEYFRLFS